MDESSLNHTEMFSMMEDIPYRNSIFGSWDELIRTKQQAINILTIADIARDVGAKLSLNDMAIEKRAFLMATKHKEKK